jgi:hypothetical protein
MKAFWETPEKNEKGVLVRMEKECPKCGSTMELGTLAGDPTWIREGGLLWSRKPVHIPKV